MASRRKRAAKAAKKKPDTGRKLQKKASDYFKGPKKKHSAARTDEDNQSSTNGGSSGGWSVSQSHTGYDDGPGGRSSHGEGHHSHATSIEDTFGSLRSSSRPDRLSLRDPRLVREMYVDLRTKETLVVTSAEVDRPDIYVTGAIDVEHAVVRDGRDYRSVFYFKPADQDVTASGVTSETQVKIGRVSTGTFRERGTGSLLYQVVNGSGAAALSELRERTGRNKKEGASKEEGASGVSVLAVYCDSFTKDVLVETDQRETDASGYVGSLHLTSPPAVLEMGKRHFVHFKLPSVRAAREYGEEASGRLGVPEEMVAVQEFYDRGRDLVPDFARSRLPSTLRSLEKMAGFEHLSRPSGRSEVDERYSPAVTRGFP